MIFFVATLLLPFDFCYLRLTGEKRKRALLRSNLPGILPVTWAYCDKHHFFDCCSFFVSFIRKDFPFILIKCALWVSLSGQSKNDNQDNFKVLQTKDPYRLRVPDSMKYLLPILDSVLQSDQNYRYGTVNNPNGMGEQAKAIKKSNEHEKEIRYIDSINSLTVMNILDKYGWLGAKDIGYLGNKAISMVIQHSNVANQEKYIPLLRKAVINKKESPHTLALLEDRISLRNNKCQLYGTQVFYSFIKSRYYLYPIIEPENIIERRKSIGLDSSSLFSYLNAFHISWNIETYKKELPEVQQLILKSSQRIK